MAQEMAQEMTTPVRVRGVEELTDLVGQTLGPSSSLRIDQPMIDAFAQATGDQQWIHVDAARAKSESPWGGTIAHGYLVLSVLPVLMFERLLVVEGFGSMINYGLDKLRFPSVTPVGSEVRLTATLDSLEPKGGGHLGRFSLSFQADGAPKPCCVAQVLIVFSP